VVGLHAGARIFTILSAVEWVERRKLHTAIVCFGHFERVNISDNLYVYFQRYSGSVNYAELFCYEIYAAKTLTSAL